MQTRSAVKVVVFHCSGAATKRFRFVKSETPKQWADVHSKRYCAGACAVTTE
jgi:hypothetical protein